MSQPFRLSEGGCIDRAKPVGFSFNGKQYQGYAGDSLASALLANGVRLVARSFKYHRPRGIVTAGSEEPNALVQLETGAYTQPNTRATRVELYDGLAASSQNCWPSVGYDLGAINSIFARLMPAGFYYKTFMWPASMWMAYERLIRKMAGAGKTPLEPDPDRYEIMHAHCDVLVVGGGPAGLVAALTAARTGARVILADEQVAFGGALRTGERVIDGRPALEWVARTVAELEVQGEVTLLPRTTVAGYYDYNFLTALEQVTDHLAPARRGSKPRQRFWRIRAKRVVLGTGALERPLIFADNDRPGVMLAGAVRRYINHYGVLPGRQMLVFTNNDDAYRTAVDAMRAGARVEVVDVRPNPRGLIVEETRTVGIPVHVNAAVTGVHGTKGVKGAEVMTLSDNGRRVAGAVRGIYCDVIAMSGGWTPSVHLFSQAGGKLRYDDALAAFVPGHSVRINPNTSAGACKGSYRLAACLKEGMEAGAQAAAETGFGGATAPSAPDVNDHLEQPTRVLWTIPCDHPLGRGSKEHFLDFQNDVTAADIHLAAREGYLSVEHLKRYTTTGMGSDQGKTSNMAALAILANLRETGISEVGTTTYRPPYTPVTLGAIAGRNVDGLFVAKRKTPIHPWHERCHAPIECVGNWLRPWYFPRPGEDMDAAVQRECKAVRTSVGIADVSTLGKIDIRGPDAVEFLDCVYTNAWSNVEVGCCRYGLMLNEQGMVCDDGVTTRLAEDRFHMTTTTGGAAWVMSWLEEWLQTQWSDLNVYLTSVTEQWAVIALSGPESRGLLRALTNIDLERDAFPFMSMREGHVAGVPARVFRISFTGELGFEINVPARYGLHVWQTLVDRGADFDICPYGTESLHVLRAEKGFIITGQDTDGTLTPLDLGMNWIVSKAKRDFLGKRSFSRREIRRKGRRQLVGLLTETPDYVIPKGTHIVAEVRPEPPMPTIGHVTSSYLSPNVGRSIALGLVEDGLSRMGEVLVARTHDGRTERVRVTQPVFFDKEGARARA